MFVFMIVMWQAEVKFIRDRLTLMSSGWGLDSGAVYYMEGVYGGGLHLYFQSRWNSEEGM